MEELFDTPKPLSSDAPVVPLGKRVFNPSEYHLDVANAVVSALGLPAQVHEHNRNTLAAHFNKRKPDASDVSLPAEMPIDKYSAHINQSGDALLTTLLNDAQRWCQQRTYDGSKLSTEVLKSNLTLALKKRMDAMFEEAPVFTSKQRQLTETVFGVSSKPAFSSPKPVAAPTSFASPNFVSSSPTASSFATPSDFSASSPQSAINAHGPKCGCGYCEQAKKKKKKKTHKPEEKPEMEWRRDVYSKPASTMKPIEAVSTVNVTDPTTGKPHTIPLTPIAAQSGSIFDTNKSVDVSGRWKPEYFGRVGGRTKTLTDQFLEYAATQIQSSNADVFFLPTEAKLAEVKATADQRGAQFPFESLWARHAAVHVNTNNEANQARSLSENIGTVFHDGKTLSVPKLAQHYVKIIESKQQQIGGKTVTVHIHEGLFIPKQ